MAFTSLHSDSAPAKPGHTRIAVLKGLVAHLRHRIETPGPGMTSERAAELLPAYQRRLASMEGAFHARD